MELSTRIAQCNCGTMVAIYQLSQLLSNESGKLYVERIYFSHEFGR
jgi:hypothetical protein